jgi:phosphate transport system substrate-binding protein
MSLVARDILRCAVVLIAVIGAGGATRAGLPSQTVQIKGAGATFPYPLYSAWFSEYGRIRPDLQMNYLSIGSGVGIQQLMEAIVFFGATDAPMTEEEIQESRVRLLNFLESIFGFLYVL